MIRSPGGVIRDTTLDYLVSVSEGTSKEEVESELLIALRNEFALENAPKEKSDKWKMPQELPSISLAYVLVKLHNVIRLQWMDDTNGGDDTYSLAVYQDSGENEGIYVDDKAAIEKLIVEYSQNISSSKIDEVIRKLNSVAPTRKRTMDKNLIAVNNGIFNYQTKQLMPFDPKYVFTTKSRVNYNPSATNIVIHNDEDGTDWDVESWMADLSDDPEIVELLWQILGAIIRPNVDWNKTAWFYSKTGNNGKGTLCELMRNLCGPGAYASISLADFGKDFRLEALPKVSAIIVDENDVGEYVDSAASLKSVSTHDIIQINRKYKPSISFRFYGFMVQCLNDFPKFKDKTGSFYRRQLIVPFDKCFTGKERKYIKSDYLKRPEVLEYVMYKVLNTNYDSLCEPQACKELLGYYKEFNDPVRQFLSEMLPKCVWDLLPFAFLYELYKEWFKRNCPSGKILSKTSFIDTVTEIAPSLEGWEYRDRNVSLYIRNKTSMVEPLIVRYNLIDWMNENYHGDNLDLICQHGRSTCKGGLERVAVVSGAPEEDTSLEEETVE